jgi:hypothetical protein
MVGVVFIFIIMLGYFASQFHSTRSELLRTDDPRTTLLLQSATNLERSVQPVEIDYAERVVCLPRSFLRVEPRPGQEPQDRRCFSYAETKPKEAEVTTEAKLEIRRRLTEALADEVDAPADLFELRAAEGRLVFDADKMFTPGTDALTAEGSKVAADAAAALARLLPCHGYLEASTRAAARSSTVSTWSTSCRTPTSTRSRRRVKRPEHWPSADRSLPSGDHGQPAPAWPRT